MSKADHRADTGIGGRLRTGHANPAMHRTPFTLPESSTVRILVADVASGATIVLVQTLMFAMRAPAPELIVLDVNMPGGTGVEALRKLQQSTRTCGIPVIVVSGVDDPAMPPRMRELGALDVLPKPVDPARLLDAVDRAAGRAVA